MKFSVCFSFKTSFGAMLFLCTFFQQKTYDAEKKKQQEMELRTMDVLRPGEMQPERDHNFTSE
ncbi:MAG: hypothetical protein EOO61_15085, partial [Hymenobacter sp.]